MAYSHAIVWLDHSEAHLIHFDRDTSEKKVVRSPGGREHLHHRSGSVGAGRTGAHDEYFRAILEGLGAVPEFLVTGPAEAKNEFVRYVNEHAPQSARRIAGVDPLDHPSDGQLLAHARRRFPAIDNMR